MTQPKSSLTFQREDIDRQDDPVGEKSTIAATGWSDLVGSGRLLIARCSGSAAPRPIGAHCRVPRCSFFECVCIGQCEIQIYENIREVKTNKLHTICAEFSMTH